MFKSKFYEKRKSIKPNQRLLIHFMITFLTHKDGFLYTTVWKYRLLMGEILYIHAETHQPHNKHLPYSDYQQYYGNSPHE